MENIDKWDIEKLKIEVWGKWLEPDKLTQEEKDNFQLQMDRNGYIITEQSAVMQMYLKDGSISYREIKFNTDEDKI